MSSLNRYIILNLLAAFLLSFVAISFSLSFGSLSVSKQVEKIILEQHPEYADMTEEEALAAGDLLAIETTPEQDQEMANTMLKFLLIGGFGGTLLIIWLFVFKIRRRIVRELNRFDAALGTLPEISGGNPEAIAEIHSGIREFDQICLRFNQITNRLKGSENERKRLEGQQRKMIADISHDLKTPITVIQGYSKAVRDNVADEETKKKYLDAICRKSEMVSELINTFHEFSKLGHPDYSFHMTEGDLCEYLREYLALKYHDLELSGFGLEVDLPDRPIPFCFDKQQFSRVFENLISNSLRYNSAGTVLYASLSESGDGILIRLGDNGQGIPEELRRIIFEPFVVGTESRTNSRGSGLGLAICKRIVEAHQGSIVLAGDPAGICKTLYEIRFPKYTAAASANEQTSDRQQSVSG